MLPEFDPYKYNSFPVAAGEQIYGLTSELETRLSQRSAAGPLAGFPPVLAFQSVVDATIPARSVVDRLLNRLPSNGSELVLFDLNRIAEAEDFLRGDHESSLRALLESPELPFALTLITNAHEKTRALVARARPAGRSPGSPARTPLWSEVPLGLSWPRGVFSFSHVALPFPADDPIYGLGDAHDDPQALHLGALEPRGERSPRHTDGSVDAAPLQPLLPVRGEAHRGLDRGALTSPLPKAPVCRPPLSSARQA